MKKLFLILGKSGSGKTTIAKYITQQNKEIEYYSMGDEFRKIANKNHEIGKYVFSGKRVPEKVAEDVLSKVIDKFSKDIIIIDGFPRDHKQTKLLKLLLKNKNIEVKNVIEIILNENTASERVLNRLRGNDDNIKVFNDRLKDYTMQMKHIREYYKNILINIDGNDKVENISRQILDLMLFTDESNSLLLKKT